MVSPPPSTPSLQPYNAQTLSAEDQKRITMIIFMKITMFNAVMIRVCCRLLKKFWRSEKTVYIFVKKN